MEKKENYKYKIQLLNESKKNCIIQPEITCDNQIGDIHYVSKIQKKSVNLINEKKMGEQVKNIHHYDFFFAPIIDSCEVSISNTNDSIIKEKCNMINKMNNNNAYESNKIRYIGKKNIEKYLLSLPKEENLLIKKLYNTYYYNLHSLKKLAEKNIIHFNVKENNIMYDESNHSPIIIDFSVSYNPSVLKTEDDYKKSFYTTLFYPYWCFDIYVLSFIIHKDEKSNLFSEEILNELVESYLTDFKDFSQKWLTNIKEEEYNNYKKELLSFFSSYVGEPFEKVFESLFKEEIYSTWDNYSLALTYLIISNSLEINEDDNLVKLCKYIVFSGPGNRKNPEQTIEEFVKFI